MGGGLGVLVSVLGTKGCVVTCGCTVGVHGKYVSMSICVICWLSWYICVHREVIFSSLEYIWLLSWELVSARLYIAVLDEFFSTKKCESAMLMIYAFSYIVVNVAAFSE